MLDDSPYWTQQRRELVQWLEDRAPSFTYGYVAAIRLLYTPAFPARVHLVCHLVRDMYHFLPAALGMKTLPRPGEVFPCMIKDLAKKWQESGSTLSRESGSVGSDVPVSAEVYCCISRLVNKYGDIADQPSIGKQLATALFRSANRREDEFIHPWIIKSFDSEYKFFVKRAHLARTLDKVPTDEGLMEHFEAFERAFHSLVGSYFTGKEELDAILQDTNATTD